MPDLDRLPEEAFMSAHEPRPPAAMDDRARTAGACREDSGSDERTPSVRDLLAACAAADAVSTPPRAPAPGPAPDADDEGEPDGPHRRAAA
ncbi:hypothetical protein J7W19_13650 [Streptomyces mobaraensis NBRC 13819 = DSM 40847]|nr:hypothetical protein [Streptomyces mobaraensis]QTT78260.1 hypothetical protein J7W19_13650 [Streptomyces mobaraensis NBRC 13819 = DSM 40847]